MTHKFLTIPAIAGLLSFGCTSTPTVVPPPTPKVEAPTASIHQAAYKGDSETIDQHYAAGTDIDLRNQWNATPLHYAARAGKPTSAKALVGHGADVNAKNDDGDTPLHYAASKGNPVIVTLLVQKKANVNEQDGEGLTPLHLSLIHI